MGPSSDVVRVSSRTCPGVVLSPLGVSRSRSDEPLVPDYHASRIRIPYAYIVPTTEHIRHLVDSTPTEILSIACRCGGRRVGTSSIHRKVIGVLARHHFVWKHHRKDGTVASQNWYSIQIQRLQSIGYWKERGSPWSKPP